MARLHASNATPWHVDKLPYKVLSMTDKTAHFLSLSVQGKCIMLDAMLEFTVKEVYGVSRYYPNNRKSRCIVNHLMKQKCLTATQVKSLNTVGGFNINVKKNIGVLI